MPRHYFPGLQGKFFNLLRKEFAPNDRFSGLDVQDKVRSRGATWNMSPEEIEFICKGSGNFLTSAKKAGVIESFGKKRGYQLIDLSVGPVDQSRSEQAANNVSELNAATSSLTAILSAKGQPPSSILSESFLHFPATLLLAHEFEGHIMSLPPKMDGKKWGNPDMIMIQDNRASRLEPRDDDEEAEVELMNWEKQLELLAKVDNSPPYIVSSIELKLGLKNRSEVVTALAETAMNGRWANETLLVYLEQNGLSEEILEHEPAIEFARSNGIGIYAICLNGAHAGDLNPLELRQILPASVRSTLDLKSLWHKGNGNRALFKRVLRLINEYSDEGPLIGQTDATDAYTLARVLLQAVKNLGTQRDFGEVNLGERIANAKGSEETVVEAICEYLPAMFGGEMFSRDFQAELDEELLALPAKDSYQLRAVLNALTVYPGRSAQPQRRKDSDRQVDLSAEES